MEHYSTILIVDDEPDSREMLAALLTGQGYNLVCASDGVEALTKAMEITPDVVLLDVMMPGMDGFEVCRRLRDNPHLAEVPVILVTALDDRKSRLQGIEVGADEFISKPFDRLELRARVKTTTRFNRYRRLLVERTRFAWVIEQANDGYLLLNEQDVVLYTNPQARLYLNLPNDKNEVGELFLTLAQRQYQCEPEAAWATWPVTSAEMTPRYLVRPESSTARAFWLEVNVLNLPPGQGFGRIVHLRDVTTHMAAQRNIQTFHAMIFHKLHTPLTHMLTGLELLSKYAGDDASVTEVAKLVEIALYGAKRLKSEIEDILQYVSAPLLAKPGTGFFLGQLQPTITAISTDLGLTALTISIPEEWADIELTMSQEAVELVLWEVLENAQKFHPQQSPTVDISATWFDSNSISLRIADNGITLSPEQLSQAWQPYYQGEKYFTGEMTGMGLGLALVSALMWEAGGKCHLYNQVDRSGVVAQLIFPTVKPTSLNS